MRGPGPGAGGVCLHSADSPIPSPGPDLGPDLAGNRGPVPICRGRESGPGPGSVRDSGPDSAGPGRSTLRLSALRGTLAVVLAPHIPLRLLVAVRVAGQDICVTGQDIRVRVAGDVIHFAGDVIHVAGQAICVSGIRVQACARGYSYTGTQQQRRQRRRTSQRPGFYGNGKQLQDSDSEAPHSRG